MTTQSGLDILRDFIKELYTEFKGNKEKYLEYLDNQIDMAREINFKYSNEDFMPVIEQTLVIKREFVATLLNQKID